MHGKHEYCKFCQMQEYGYKCIASPACRSKLCAKAREYMRRAETKGEPQECKAKHIKEYLKYISARIKYLKMFCGDIPSNELRFYCALRQSIKEWGKTHAAVYGYLYGKLSAKQVCGIVGVSARQFWRMIGKQSADLAAFIKEQENALEDKYPFIPFADLLEVKRT